MIPFEELLKKWPSIPQVPPHQYEVGNNNVIIKHPTYTINNNKLNQQIMNQLYG